MKLFYSGIIYSFLLINIPTYSMTEKEYSEYLHELRRISTQRDWSICDALRFIYEQKLNKTPSELADYFGINDAPIFQFERENPNDRYEQNYHTALYIFIKSNYTFKDFLKTLQKAYST